MNILVIILFLFILLSLLLLLTPIDIIIDSKLNQYQIKWWRWLDIHVVEKNGRPWMGLHVLLWNRELDLVQILAKKKSKKEVPTKDIEKRKNRVPFKRLSALLKSFEVKECHLNVDLGDYVWNAYCYPLFYFLNRHHWQWNWQINFQGEQQIRLLIRNRPIRIIKALLQ